MLEQIILTVIVLCFIVFSVQMIKSEYVALWLLIFIIAVGLMYAFYRMTGFVYIFLLLTLLLLIKPVISRTKK